MNKSIGIEEKQKAGNREWLALLSLSIPTMLVAIDTSVLYLALPQLSATLKANSAEQLWIMDIYGFMITGFLMIMGNLGDRIGYRKLLTIGSVAFSLAAVIAAFSPSAYLLIAARAMMGIAGATLMPSALALIRNIFVNPEERGTAISIWMSCFMAGMIIGPLAGGWMLEYFWWGSVFLLDVPVMLVIVFAGRMLLPEYCHGIKRPIDLTGAIMSLAAILPFIYGLTEISRNNLTVFPVFAAVSGVFFGIAFIIRERKTSDALVDFKLFKNHTFRSTLLTMLLTALIMGGVALFVAQYLQMVSELSPFKAGLWLIPQAVGMIIGSLIVQSLAKKIKQQIIISVGLSFSFIGMVLLTYTPVHNGLVWLEAGFVTAVFGASPILILGTGIIIASAPPEKAGSAASLSETSNQLGVALGVAILGSIGTFVYRAEIIKDLHLVLPADLLKVAAESIVSAHSLAHAGNRPEHTQFIAKIKEAYVNGLHMVAAAGAAIFALLTLITGYNLRHLNTSS
ncbi:MAG TPA: MFS transporter [Puia sp.]|nr:MFS transporter [Puia sp.]